MNPGIKEQAEHQHKVILSASSVLFSLPAFTDSVLNSCPAVCLPARMDSGPQRESKSFLPSICCFVRYFVTKSCILCVLLPPTPSFQLSGYSSKSVWVSSTHRYPHGGKREGLASVHRPGTPHSATRGQHLLHKGCCFLLPLHSSQRQDLLCFLASRTLDVSWKSPHCF